MKKLSLGKILDALAERIALAEKDNMPIEDFLLMIFLDEIERRRGAAAARRADQAGLDPTMVMETTDLNWTLDTIAHEWTHNYLKNISAGWEPEQNCLKFLPKAGDNVPVSTSERINSASFLTSKLPMMTMFLMRLLISIKIFVTCF